MGVKITIVVVIFFVTFVGKGAITNLGDKDIEKRKELLDLISDVNRIWGEMILRWVKNKLMACR